jgi:hypothetical protein
MRALLAELRPSAITDTDLGDLLHLLGNALAGRINIPVRGCLKTRQKGKNRANLGDDQINSNLPD